MLLHQGQKTHQIQVLLDTGYSIALINERTIEKLRIEMQEHKQAYNIESYTRESVPGAGQFYTKPMLLQHQKHYSMEKFEVSPMDAEIDVFLPLESISAHPPQGTWTNQEVQFNSARCLTNCTRFETGQFSLTWDDMVATDPTTYLIGCTLAVSEEEPLKTVLLEFHQYLGIMGQEAADALPKHHNYDCKIELQEGSTAPWGSIYPLSEEELQTLHEWLKEME